MSWKVSTGRDTWECIKQISGKNIWGLIESSFMQKDVIHFFFLNFLNILWNTWKDTHFVFLQRVIYVSQIIFIWGILVEFSPELLLLAKSWLLLLKWTLWLRQRNPWHHLSRPRAKIGWNSCIWVDSPTARHEVGAFAVESFETKLDSFYLFLFPF